jgi:hypothetical protein
LDLFTEFMRELKSNQAVDIECDFLPMSFDDMVEFLSYRSLRENICLGFVNEHQWPLKFEQCMKLFDLQEEQRSERTKIINKAISKNNRVKNNDVELLTEAQMIKRLASFDLTKFERVNSDDMNCIKGDQILEKYQNERRFTFNDEQIEDAIAKLAEQNILKKSTEGKGGMEVVDSSEVTVKKSTPKSTPKSAQKSAQKTLDNQGKTRWRILLENSMRKLDAPVLDIGNIGLNIKKKPPTIMNLITKGAKKISDFPKEIGLSDNQTYYRVRKDKYGVVGQNEEENTKLEKKMGLIKEKLDFRIRTVKSAAKIQTDTFLNELNGLSKYHDHSKYLNRKRGEIINNYNSTGELKYYSSAREGFSGYNPPKSTVGKVNIFGAKKFS